MKFFVFVLHSFLQKGLIFLYEYILFFFFIGCLFHIAYIKIKYPFWNLQPVLHKYDYIRRFQKKPFVVFLKTGKISNKFLRPIQIKTFEYSLCDQKKIHKFIDFIQCNYLDSDNILILNNEKTYHSDEVKKNAGIMKLVLI